MQLIQFEGRTVAVIAPEDLEALEAREQKLREHIVNLLPYAHMLLRGEKPIAAYADLLPYVVANAQAAVKP